MPSQPRSALMGCQVVAVISVRDCGPYKGYDLGSWLGKAKARRCVHRVLCAFFGAVTVRAVFSCCGSERCGRRGWEEEENGSLSGTMGGAETIHPLGGDPFHDPP